MSNSAEHDAIEAHRKVIVVIYALQALSFLAGITFIIAVIMAYVKKGSAPQEWVASHFKWQIRTFWFSLVWIIVGLMTFSIGIGIVILILNSIWTIYRIVKGWLRLNDSRGMYKNTIYKE